MVEQFADESRKKICLLIDGDNAQPSLLGKMLAEVAKYGLVTIRRIYGDWTTANMGGWKQALHENAIQPIQQFRYTIGKNATDSAMIIDAMDILHGHLVDGFCLVSSDSDYTRLATRIREMGFFVMGIGKEKTPRAFVNACNLFIYTENLVPKRPPREHERPSRRTGRGGRTERADAGEPAEGGERAARLDPVPLLRGAVDMAVQEDGWANLGTIGFTLRQLDPGFDPRTYGYKQLSQLFKAHPSHFELRLDEKGGRGDIFVRLKE